MDLGIIGRVVIPPLGVIGVAVIGIEIAVANETHGERRSN